MIVHRIIEPIKHEKFVGKFGVELLVAHAAVLVFFSRGKLMGALGENVALFIKPIDTTNAFGIHQIGGVPTARCIDHDVIRSLVGGVILSGSVQV